MAPYDSDSDDYDAQDYTETDVLLGYASKDSKGETISRLGGRPVRLAFSYQLQHTLMLALLMQYDTDRNGLIIQKFPRHHLQDARLAKITWSSYFN
jgi:pre-rRNA-processing protein TSR4